MPKNLLLADDSITIQKVVAITFAGEDVRITTVDNGEDAVARARELRPDVILADVVMPRRNGYEVCEAVKADPTLQHIPVLLLAGTFEAFDEGRARAARADGHIAKPFESQALINKVKELLGEKVAAPAPRAPAPSVAATGGAVGGAVAPRAQPARPPAPAAPPADVRPFSSPPAAGRAAPVPGQGTPSRQPLPGTAAGARPPGAVGVPSVPRPVVPQVARPAGALAAAASAAGVRVPAPAPLAPGLAAPGARAPQPPGSPAPEARSTRPVSPPASAPRPAPIPTLQARPSAAPPQSSPTVSARRDPLGLDAPASRPPPAAPSVPAPAALEMPLPPTPVLARAGGVATKPSMGEIELDLAPAMAPAADDWSDVDLTDIEEEESASPAGQLTIAAASGAEPKAARAEEALEKKPSLEPAKVVEPPAVAPIATLDEIDFGEVARPVGSSLDGKGNAPAVLEELELTPVATPAPFASEPRTLAAQLEELPELDAEDAIELPPASEPAAKIEQAQAHPAAPAVARALEKPAPVRPEAPAPAPSKTPVPGLAASAQADGGEAMLREALSRASREVIERIAWEVVPQLAETILREQIDRLAKERQR